MQLHRIASLCFSAFTALALQCNVRIAIAASSNDVRAILTLINLNLEAAPPEVAVETIRIDMNVRKISDRILLRETGQKARP